MPLFKHVCTACRFRFMGLLPDPKADPWKCPKCDAACVRSNEAISVGDFDLGKKKGDPKMFILPPNCS